MELGLVLGDPSSAVEDARRAEQLGFRLLGCGEHVFFHSPTANSLVALAAAAGATERIRLVSSVALLPLYPVALLAKLAATLDQVSGGRFELGVGAGGEFVAEFEACGVDPVTRFQRLDEGLELLRRLFSGEAVTWEGTFSRLSDVALRPPPTTPGGPPLWLGGRKPGATRRAGRFADVWMPYMVDPGQVRRGLAQVRDAAEEYGRAPDAVSGALYVWCCVDTDGGKARARGVEAVSRTYDQDFAELADRYLLLGDPGRVRDRLAEFAESGVESVLLQPAGDRADRERTIGLIAEDILPHLPAG